MSTFLGRVRSSALLSRGFWTRQWLVFSSLGLAVLPAQAAFDFTPLWDYAQPERSEQAFRAALDAVGPEDKLVLQTQIARSYGLRREFDRARSLLSEIEAACKQAGPRVKAHYALELGRSYASAKHAPAQISDAQRGLAQAAFLEAQTQARLAGEDALLIDALHMMVFVDTAPADQIRWNREALQVSAHSSQPAAQRWEASLRNNLGYALHQEKDYDAALREFQRALVLREAGQDAGAIRVAKWMIAWTLRSQSQFQEALAMQLALEAECAAAGQPDPYVFEELAELYRALGDAEKAAAYAAKSKQ